MSRRLLTVAIQTYNRGPKVETVVRRFINHICSEKLEDQVEIHVSDNASPDDTEARLRPLASEQPVRVRYTRQAENLQFDGNTAFLYEATQSPYMWLFGDDDIPFDGSLTRIVETLRSTQPDLLLFSFAQPPESATRQFDYPEPVQVVSNPRTQAELIVRYTKISIFVFRVLRLDERCRAMLSHYLLNPGWYYVGLAYTILGAANTPKLAVISEPLAGSDADWAKVAYTPMPYLTLGDAVDHAFVRKAAPELITKVRRGGYRTAVSWCLQAKLGRIDPERSHEYDSFFWDELPFRPWSLLGSPRAAWAYFLVWSGLWRLIAPCASRRHARVRHNAT